jgi:hypothetical protein
LKKRVENLHTGVYNSVYKVKGGLKKRSPNERRRTTKHREGERKSNSTSARAQRRFNVIEDDSMTMNVKWPVEEDRRDALSAMIEDCYKGFLSCNRLEEYLWRQDDVRLTRAIVVTDRHAKFCFDMWKTLLNWDSYYPEEVRAAVEDFVPKCELATLELRKYLPEWTPGAHAEGLLPAIEGTIRSEHAAINNCLSSCLDFARVWFDINL